MAVQGHNNYRRAHQVPDIKFDKQTAEAAQKWADKLSLEGNMYHCDGEECGGCGENMATHSDRTKLSTTNYATWKWYNQLL